MSKVKRTETGLEFVCDCGIVTNIEKDGDELILKSQYKKPLKEEEEKNEQRKKRKDIFDELTGSGTED